MIAIVNVSEDVADRGPQEYEVRINRMVVGTFTHNREDDLETCLKKAAAAVKGLKRKLPEDLYAAMLEGMFSNPRR